MSTFLVAVIGCLFTWAAIAAGPATIPSPGPDTASTNSAVELEFQALLARDDAAQAAASEMIANDDQASDSLSSPLRVTLRARMDQKFQPVRDAYVDFLLKHPDFARGHLAFGSFLSDLGDDSEALVHYEKARDLAPRNPAAWNNLGGLYARLEKVGRAFACYEEAIRLNTNQASYPHSLGTLICLFPREAGEYYHCPESETIPKAVSYYETAIRLDSENFEYSQDLAETFYATLRGSTAKPEAREDWGRKALGAWTNALSRTAIDIQREGVYLHMARWHLRLGEKASASLRLGQVTHRALLPIKRELMVLLDPTTNGERSSVPSDTQSKAETGSGSGAAELPTSSSTTPAPAASRR